MPVSIYEWEKTVSGWDWIEVTENKVINLILRELNNLIKINSNNEVYVDLQLDDNLQSTATIPVGVNVWRVLQANGFPVTWTLITAKTTSWDTVKVLYGDDGEIRVDNGTGEWEIVQYEMHAGEWISITDETYVDNQWPCPDWFHVPTASQWSDIKNNLRWSAVYNRSTCETLLKLPAYWGISAYWEPDMLNNMGYWCCTSSSNGRAMRFTATTEYIPEPTNTFATKHCGYPIRPFKDTPVEPDDTWTALVAGSVYWNAELWLISLRLNASRWLTIADKNLWATVVYEQWDTKSEANCGYSYQRWNNHWFSYGVRPEKTSTTLVDASWYWPWNYYSSDTFIIADGQSYDWSSVENRNLRWWVTLSVTEIDNVITNTWVLSVNWQTGHVNIESWAIVPVVSEYPSNPVDWQMIIYQASLQIYYNNEWVLITVLGQ